MAGYTKLFSDIVDSSIWREDSDTCKVWVTLLALSDADGYIRGSTGWLAAKAHVPLSVCESALTKFQTSDPSSRTPDHDGKRIEQLPDGWLILNYLAFRDRLSDDPSAISSRERVRKHRERYKALRNAESVTPSVSASASASDRKEGTGGKTEKARPEDPFFVAYRDIWAKQFGHPYCHTQADFVQLAQLKKQLDGSITPEAFADVCRKAWTLLDEKSFERSVSMTLKGFCSQFSKVYAVVKTTKPKMGQEGYYQQKW